MTLENLKRASKAAGFALVGHDDDRDAARRTQAAAPDSQWQPATRPVATKPQRHSGARRSLLAPIAGLLGFRGYA